MKGRTVRNAILAVSGFLSGLFFYGVAAAQDSAKAERPELRVGDSWLFERTDRGSSAKTDVARKVLAVGAEELTIASTEGATATEQKWTRELNYVSGDGKRVARPHSQSLAFPLSLGRQWKVDGKGVTAAGSDATLEGNCKASAYEKVTVKAGTFDAFKVECDNEFYIYGSRIKGTQRLVQWYSPAVKFPVRTELMNRDRLTVFADWTQELVSTTVK
jgi:hypothetical protein